MKRIYFVFTVLSLIMLSCQSKTLVSSNELLEADKDFSSYSMEHGTREAFLQFAADSAVMLRDNSLPVIGIMNIGKLFGPSNPNSTLTWEPKYAKIAASGELGYTYGLYKSVVINGDSTSVSEGSYVSVWQKNNSGDWKWVLDCGTTGLK